MSMMRVGILSGAVAWFGVLLLVGCSLVSGLGAFSFLRSTDEPRTRTGLRQPLLSSPPASGAEVAPPGAPGPSSPTSNSTAPSVEVVVVDHLNRRCCTTVPCPHPLFHLLASALQEDHFHCTGSRGSSEDLLIGSDSFQKILADFLNELASLLGDEEQVGGATDPIR